MIGYALDLYLPLVISNVLHMFVVKYDLLPMLKVPIRENSFGKNKTYRGLFFVTLTTGVFQLILSNKTQGSDAFTIGLLLGFTYVLFELPNSWLKRKLGIAPGEKSDNHKSFFLILDKTDSAFGVSLVYCLLFSLSFYEFIFLFLFASFTHLFFSLILVKFKVKASL